jgi:hypothetical protein
MKLVIDIDEEEYMGIKNAINSLIKNGVERASMSKVCLAILDGTPIPKGHGRLIDKDALGEKLHRYTEAPYQYALTVFNESPIIINADRSGDDGSNDL